MPNDYCARRRRYAAVRLAVLSLLLTGGCIGVECRFLGAALAAQPDEETAPRVNFDIPAQPLAKAIEVFSTVSGIQVLYDSALASERISTRVQGALSPLTALRKLIEGSQLVIHRTPSDDIVLVPAGAAGRQAPPGANLTGEPVLLLDPLRVSDAAPNPYAGYIGIVESEIQRTLHQDGRTRSGSYHVGLEVWLEASGAVQRSRVVHSTGNQDRDSAIVGALAALVISRPPPAEMPQPIAIRIVARSQ